MDMRPSQQMVQPPLSYGASDAGQPRAKLPAAINPFPPLLPQTPGADPRRYGRQAQGLFQPTPHELAGANRMGMADPRSHHQGFNARPLMPPLFHPLHPPSQRSIYYPPAMLRGPGPPPPNFNSASTPPGFLPANPLHLPRPPQHWPPEVPRHMHAMPPLHPQPQFPHFQHQPETFASGQTLGVQNSWGRGPPPPPPPETVVSRPGSSGAGGGLGSAEGLDPFVADWLKIVGAAKKQRCPEHSSLKVRERVRVRLPNQLERTVL